MPSFRLTALAQTALLVTLLLASICKAQETMTPSAAPSSTAPESTEPLPPPLQPPPSNYDKAIFQKPIPAANLAFIAQFANAPSNELYRDKQFRKFVKSAIPGCMFHYGNDKPLDVALDEVMEGSPIPVQIRDNRYVLVAGQQGTHHYGRGFLWIDLQDGNVLGGFFFRPNNGEPTPTLTVFSKQVRERAIALTELPPAFAQDLAQWTADANVPPLLTRYFIGGINKRILLEHDEDYCATADGSLSPDSCRQMDADAADLDLNTAGYLEQVHYATNATAWMIDNPDQTAWLGVRASTCGGFADPLGCRIRMTHERIHVITRRR